MDVRILGPLEVWAAGRPLPLGGTKQRAVLAMLALHANQVVSIDYLVDGLWGQASPDSATNVVQVYISRLRKLLHASPREGSAAFVLVRRRPGYLLELDADELDLARFERLAHQGTQALRPAPRLAAAKLREALELWRGPPLAEFTDEPFAQAESARLEEQRLTVLQARIEADLALGRHAELIGELEALVARQPLREELHQQLLLSLYRSGRQAEALEAYRRVRQTLAEELGIDPGRALQELQAAILAQDGRLDWIPPPDEPTPTIGEPTPRSLVGTTPAGIVPADGAVAPRTAGQLPEVWKVPMRNPHFTGRTGLLDQLRQRLRSGEGTLVVQALYGLGGVGKTQLAIEYAHRFAADYDLVWWIDAEQPVFIAGQLAQLGDKLNLPPRPTVADTVELVLAELRRRRRWLLIFDNAERPQHLADYQPGGAGHVLVTSRSPGWGALGGRLEVDVLARPETVALLCRGSRSWMIGWPTSWLPSWAIYRWPPPRPPPTWNRPACHRVSICTASAPDGPACWQRARCSATRGGWTPPGRCRWNGRSGTPAAVPLLELAAFLAPSRSRCGCSPPIPSCWKSPYARPRRTLTLSMTCSGQWSASRWPAASPTAFSCTGSSRRSSASSVPPPSSRPPPTRY